MTLTLESLRTLVETTKNMDKDTVILVSHKVLGRWDQFSLDNSFVADNKNKFLYLESSTTKD